MNFLREARLEFIRLFGAPIFANEDEEAAKCGNLEELKSTVSYKLLSNSECDDSSRTRPKHHELAVGGSARVYTIVWGPNLRQRR